MLEARVQRLLTIFCAKAPDLDDSASIKLARRAWGELGPRLDDGERFDVSHALGLAALGQGRREFDTVMARIRRQRGW